MIVLVCRDSRFCSDWKQNYSGSKKWLDLSNKSPKEEDKKVSSEKYRSFNLDQNLWKNLQYLWRQMTEEKVTEKISPIVETLWEIRQREFKYCYLLRKNSMLE
jgi:hypothetical protein